MNYTKTEIAAIFSACGTKKEVMQSCDVFRHLMLLNSQDSLRGFTVPAGSRIKALRVDNK
jgi:hypothetical protein